MKSSTAPVTPRTRIAAVDVRPWENVTETATDVLTMLRENVGLDVWMLNRLDGDIHTTVAVYPEGLVRPGMSLPWGATFCRVMVAGEAPQVASVVSAVPEYVVLREELTRLGLERMGMPGAYVGVPVRRADQTLYGTLCGYARRAQSPNLRRQLGLVRFGGQVLATALEGVPPAKTPLPVPFPAADLLKDTL
ncbi:GAF domain-containing protein [Rhodococcus sp. X156]|uniref:GAF domain-containing protein n=1 Tax=Rhodococcus sp. X156 TaxID=2499145 RepID=UPI000FD741DC|nr:GAF domain-containing protein [Rhodococcus sp. X156]